jgi:hypothetical protein
LVFLPNVLKRGLGYYRFLQLFFSIMAALVQAVSAVIFVGAVIAAGIDLLFNQPAIRPISHKRGRACQDQADNN